MLWTFDLASFAVSSPTLACDGETLYVGCDAGWDFKTKTSKPAKFYALRTRDGKSGTMTMTAGCTCQ